jgi:L-fucose isomerase-like protein
VVGTPFINTCRAQIEVQLSGDQQAVLENMRGFHCMIIYGDYTREVAYAAAKVGIKVQVI